ncbi:MAG: NADH-quinone oxidoreductase subunit H [Puniceicoccales bacterium]|jgi:NADH-quinone oxidoreductase subunit H|nr:NADH-quinone oxidoreductase subunit H [Puniceicoccales bacterium]
MNVWEIAILAAKALGVVIAVLAVAGYSVLVERKVAGWMQGRLGPNRTTVPALAAIPFLGRFLQRLGVVQLPADGLKFLFKEDPVPGHVQKFWYFFAPCLVLALPVTALVMLPFGQFPGADGVLMPLALCNVDVGFLFVFATASLGVHGILLAGWGSNSKYSFLGAVRGVAQVLSYELTLVLAVIPVVLATAAPGVESPLSLFNIVREQGGLWNVFTQPVGALLFLVAIFAESNRQPFDMPESETDLVGGFHTEYGSFKFGLFFVGEYAHMVVGSSLFVLFFLGGWNLPLLPQSLLECGWWGTALGFALFCAKVFFLIFFFVWMRWTLPRFRYDQVMRLGWSRLLPLAMANLLFYFLIHTFWA